MSTKNVPGHEDSVGNSQRSFDREAVKDWLAISGIVLAGLWALWTFAWEQRLKPQYFEEPFLKVSMDATRAFADSESTNLAGIPVTIRGTIENLSKRRLHLVPTRIWVTGERLTPGTEPRQLEANDEAQLQGDRDVVWDRYLRSKPEVIRITNTLAARWSLSPGETATFSDVAWIPANKFHQAQVNVYVQAFDREDYCTKVEFLRDEDRQPVGEGKPKIGVKGERDTCIIPMASQDAKSDLQKHSYEFVARTILALPAIRASDASSSKR